MAERTKKARRRGKGTLVLIGGREDLAGDRVILREVARHVPDGRMVLATVASHEPAGYFDRYQESFRDLGVTRISELYIADRMEAAKEEKLRQFDGVSAVFFSGGDQLRITSQISDSPIYDRIHEIYERGGLVAGTSAGASVMSETMLVGGTNARSFRIGDLHVAPGLGLLPNVIIDQHFAERGRIGRLIGAVSQSPRLLGIGLDEDTAVVVTGDNMRVIGSGAVYVVDGSGETHSNIAEGIADRALSIHDLRLHVLSHGDEFDLAARRPRPVQKGTQGRG